MSDEQLGDGLVTAAQRGDARVIDISIPFAPHIPSWPGDIPFSCGWTALREDGSSVNLAALTLSAHSGTHADAPLHVESAWSASETLPVAVFVGDAYVVDVAGVTGIDIDTLERALDGVHDCTRLLVRTGASVAGGVFPELWPVLDETAAHWLVAHGVQLFGTDAPSVDARTSTTLPVHHALFSGGAYVLENLALDAVAPGKYELLAQPLALHGADAAPVRALLRLPVTVAE
ncbi:MAG TPA: cyclase family protein [Gemmatimonas sp.]|nr:cyclase family protein [Gemmatimonas sp.]